MWYLGNPLRAGAKILAFPQMPQPRPVRDLLGLPVSLGRTGSLEVRLATTKREIRKAQRLRFRVFYEEGAAVADATAKLIRRDICAYDRICDHLIVIDHAARTARMGRLKPRVVGTYRLLRQDVAQAHSGFYSAREFAIAPMLARHPGQRFLELGRSCVLAAYRSRHTLDLLWRGLWAYVRHHRIDVMFGCASFPGTDPAAHVASLRYLALKAPASENWRVDARPGSEAPLQGFCPVTTRQALAALPPLIKGYLRAGARFAEGVVVDHQFGTTDVFAIMPIVDIDARYIAHFGGDIEHCQAA